MVAQAASWHSLVSARDDRHVRLYWQLRQAILYINPAQRKVPTLFIDLLPRICARKEAQSGENAHV